MTYSVVSAATEATLIAERIIFASGYLLTEVLRRKRASLAIEHRPPLLCENAIFMFPQIDVGMGKELLAWPHWVLKCRYTGLGILFGKFWENAHEVSKHGANLPPPPCHFLSVRESVLSKDPLFFQRAEWLLPSLESSRDVGQNVFADLVEYREIMEECDAFSREPTISSFEHVIGQIVESDFYTRARKLAAIELENQKRGSHTNHANT